MKVALTLIGIFALLFIAIILWHIVKRWLHQKREAERLQRRQQQMLKKKEEEQLEEEEKDSKHEAAATDSEVRKEEEEVEVKVQLNENHSSLENPQIILHKPPAVLCIRRDPRLELPRSVIVAIKEEDTGNHGWMASNLIL